MNQQWKRFARITPPVASLFFLLCLDGNNIFERQVAAVQSKHTNPGCMVFIDPTVIEGPKPAGYFRALPITVSRVDDLAMRLCFGAAISVNPYGTNAILLNKDRVLTDKAQSVAIRHELVHVMHGDPTTAEGHHSFIRHLWMSEEGEAHLAGLRTARALNTPLMYPAWIDYLVWIYALPISYALIVLNVWWLVRISRNESGSTPASSQASENHPPSGMPNG